MKAYALIPARGGSKGVPKKSISLLGGFPLIAYAIAAARLSKKIERTLVTTDSAEMAEVAKRFGAEVPFLRPAELARDNSTDIEFVQHAIEWLRTHEGVVPDYIAHIRPTTPLRRPSDIDTALDLIEKDPLATSLRSGYETRESPYKLVGITGGYFTGLFPHDPRPEYWNLPRQSFPPAYQPDGYVDILKVPFIQKSGTLHGDKALAYITEDTGEVDTPKDFEFLEFKLKEKNWEIYDWLKKNYS